MLVNSTMKSAITCPLTAIRERYCMSNSLNSIAYNAICPAASGLLITLCKGLLVRMTTVWRRASPLVGIFLLHLGVLGSCSTRASAPCLLAWQRLRWRLPRTLLSRGTVLPLAGKGLAMEGTRCRSSGPQMPVDIQSSIQNISSTCGRKVDTYLLPWTQTSSVLLLCRWGFVLWGCPWTQTSSALLPSLLWPGSCWGWPRYLSKTPWTPGSFDLLPRTHTCSDWVSFCKSRGCWRSLWDRPNSHPPFEFSLACRQHRLGHFFKFDVQTYCSWASNMLHSSFLGRMALLCSRRGLS